MHSSTSGRLRLGGTLVGLSRLTSRAAVEEAIAEFRHIGRHAFLDRYGFEGSRDYFLQFEGDLIDSKPVVAVAYGIEHPGHGALASSEFSGGTDGAAKALRRLGFSVASRAEMQPPRLNDEYPDRTAIQEMYGGDKVAGIVCFPGEDTVNAFSDASGPYADEPPSGFGQFGYRGDGLTGPQRLDSPGNTRLERARRDGTAVRFWYKADGQPWRFWCWVAVVGRAWVNGLDSEKTPRWEIEWCFVPVPSQEQTEWPSEVHLARESAVVFDSPELEPAARSDASYIELVRRLGAPAPVPRRSGRISFDFQRSLTARAAVLVRCGGLCENPDCTGMPAEVNKSGQPILEVDHVKDLALGGHDDPANMVALCPNCHASKTRGRNAGSLRAKLARVAAGAHAAAIQA
ncbi:HNH endonuclease signature motif containing protein [Leifsonia sp. 22587]|uniref:HNH endonuclease signature motif containing protein n=1 Tax=Leifsonia sp. 22587 TaxID=3453946 RepID=UPI003F85DEF7